ncbi:hypothetical protein ABZ656_47965 [Streptomyces sp. NPDC007095]|uniref:hypothetical protein n=1 Tax=Streptomyces sp. NPDC007095 TaxID=3154482 RepID=UPI0033CA23C3
MTDCTRRRVSPESGDTQAGPGRKTSGPGRDQGRDATAALAMWTANVCPKICEWDHKPKLDKKFNLSKNGYFIVPAHCCR